MKKMIFICKILCQGNLDKLQNSVYDGSNLQFLSGSCVVEKEVGKRII